MGQQERIGSHEQLIPICQPCQTGNHELHSASIWHEDYDGNQNVSHCKCSKCVEVKQKGLSIKTEVVE